MIDVADLKMPAALLWTCDAPLAVVDLDRARDGAEGFAPPPCPVIGVGDRSHPLAASLDAVIEPPVTIEAIARQILARPGAAAVTAQLLRALPALPVEQGLAAESLAYAVLQGSAEHRDWIAGTERPPRGHEGSVRVEREGGRLTVVLDDPAHGNAIDRTMRDALHGAFSVAALDPEIEAVSLRAEGRAFSLGAELAEFGTTTDPAEAHRIRGLTLPAHPLSRCAGKLEAHVQGACVGAGLEMAAWAARLTASANAWFQLPELAMGVLPGAGGCVSLTRRIGRQRTTLLILSGKRLGARQALAWGLVDEITGDESGADVG